MTQACHCRTAGSPALLTRLHRMGRKMVMVAGLLTNSVTMDTRMHASRVTAHGGRLLRDNIWCPIHVERPELCRPRDAVRRKEEECIPRETLGLRDIRDVGGWRGHRSHLISSLFSGRLDPAAFLIFTIRSFL